MYKLPLSTRHRILSNVGILLRSIVPDTNSRSNPERPVSPGIFPYSAACSSNGALSLSSNEVRISVCLCSAYQSAPLIASTDLIKESGRLSENPSFLLQFSLALSQILPRSVHLGQPPLVFLELFVEFIVGVLRSRPDSGERGNGGKGRNPEMGGESGDLGLEETQSTGHFRQSAESRSEGSLEGVHLGVELFSALPDSVL